MAKTLDSGIGDDILCTGLSNVERIKHKNMLIVLCQCDNISL